MAKSKIINWPTQTTLTARSSTITSSFVHTITPWLTSLTPTEEAEVRKIYTEIENKYNIKILGAGGCGRFIGLNGQPLALSIFHWTQSTQ